MGRGSGGASGSGKSGSSSGWDKVEGGYNKTGGEKVLMSGSGIGMAKTPEVHIRETDKGFVTTYRAGSFVKQETFSSVKQALGTGNTWLKEPPSNMLKPVSTYIRANGKRMTSKYSGTDVTGRAFSAGETIYYSYGSVLVE